MAVAFLLYRPVEDEVDNDGSTVVQNTEQRYYVHTIVADDSKSICSSVGMMNRHMNPTPDGGRSTGLL